MKIFLTLPLFLFIFFQGFSNHFCVVTSYRLQGERDSTKNRKDEAEQIGIDPRRFIKVYEVNTLKNTKELIWDGQEFKKDAKSNPKLKKFIDLKSEIKIYFEINPLIDAKDFFGNLSLSASVGERKLELSPYSLIGKDQLNFGIKSMPITDIETNVKAFIKTAYYLQKNVHFAKTNVVTNSKNEILFYQGLLTLSNTVTQLDVKDTLFIELNDVLKKAFVGGTVGTQKYSKWNDFYNSENSNKDISSLLEKNNDIRTIFQDNFRSNVLPIMEKKEIENFTTGVGLNLESRVRISTFLLGNEKMKKKDVSLALKTLIEDVQKLILGEERKVILSAAQNIDLYLLYFDTLSDTKDDTKSAVYNALHFDDVLMNSIKTKLVLLKKKIEESKNLNLGEIISDFEVVDKHLRILVKKFAEEAKDNLYLKRSLKDDDNSESIYEFTNAVDSYGEIRSLLSNYLYKQFVVGTINLSNAEVKEGDLLTINVLWNRTLPNDKGERDFVTLPIDRFEVKEMGWRINVADSFFLINNNGSPSASSPSVFKGAPGVSLLATYSNDREIGILRFLSPSIGINVSYLDFDKDKDVEIGAGLLLGFFRNRVFLTWGLNLNVSQTPYFGIGFSFANIASKFTEKSK